MHKFFLFSLLFFYTFLSAMQREERELFAIQPIPFSQSSEGKGKEEPVIRKNFLKCSCYWLCNYIAEKIPPARYEGTTYKERCVLHGIHNCSEATLWCLRSSGGLCCSDHGICFPQCFCKKLLCWNDEQETFCGCSEMARNALRAGFFCPLYGALCTISEDTCCNGNCPYCCMNGVADEESPIDFEFV